MLVRLGLNTFLGNGAIDSGERVEHNMSKNVMGMQQVSAQRKQARNKMLPDVAESIPTW